MFRRTVNDVIFFFLCLDFESTGFGRRFGVGPKSGTSGFVSALSSWMCARQRAVTTRIQTRTLLRCAIGRNGLIWRPDGSCLPCGASGANRLACSGENKKGRAPLLSGAVPVFAPKFQSRTTSSLAYSWQQVRTILFARPSASDEAKSKLSSLQHERCCCNALAMSLQRRQKSALTRQIRRLTDYQIGQLYRWRDALVVSCFCSGGHPPSPSYGGEAGPPLQANREGYNGGLSR
jgi:hypothetical protein